MCNTGKFITVYQLEIYFIINKIKLNSYYHFKRHPINLPSIYTTMQLTCFYQHEYLTFPHFINFVFIVGHSCSVLITCIMSWLLLCHQSVSCVIIISLHIQKLIQIYIGYFQFVIFIIYMNVFRNLYISIPCFY